MRTTQYKNKEDNTMSHRNTVCGSTHKKQTMQESNSEGHILTWRSDLCFFLSSSNTFCVAPTFPPPSPLFDAAQLTIHSEHEFLAHLFICICLQHIITLLFILLLSIPIFILSEVHCQANSFCFSNAKVL